METKSWEYVQYIGILDKKNKPIPNSQTIETCHQSPTFLPKDESIIFNDPNIPTQYIINGLFW